MCFPERGKPNRCPANSWPPRDKAHPQRPARKGGSGSPLEKKEKVDSYGIPTRHPSDHHPASSAISQPFSSPRLPPRDIPLLRVGGASKRQLPMPHILSPGHHPASSRPSASSSLPPNPPTRHPLPRESGARMWKLPFRIRTNRSWLNIGEGYESCYKSAIWSVKTESWEILPTERRSG